MLQDLLRILLYIIYILIFIWEQGMGRSKKFENLKSKESDAYGHAQLHYEEVMDLLELHKEHPAVGACQELLWQDGYKDGDWKKLL